MRDPVARFYDILIRPIMGGTHCCNACKHTGAHGPACEQKFLQEHAVTTKKPTTTIALLWPAGVVTYNGSYIQPVYITLADAYFRILSGGTVSSKLDCSGVLVSRGNDSPAPLSSWRCPGGNSGGMIPITLNANTSYDVSLNTNSSILNKTTQTTIYTNLSNVAMGGDTTDMTINAYTGNGRDNTFGKGKGGDQSWGAYVSNSGSGYGAGGGSYNGVGITSFPPGGGGGGGGFDPNAYYGLTPPITGVPESDQSYRRETTEEIGLGKPPVLFLKVLNPLAAPTTADPMT